MTPIKTLHVISDTESAAVLLEPARVRLLRELNEPSSAAELSRRLGEPRQKINYHLHELERVGLIKLVEQRRRGNCIERIVRAVAKSYLISPDIAETLPRTSASELDGAGPAAVVAMASECVRETARLIDPAAASRVPAFTLASQRTIRVASVEKFASMAAELDAAIAAIGRKYHDPGAPDRHRVQLNALVHPTSAPERPMPGVIHEVKLAKETDSPKIRAGSTASRQSIPDIQPVATRRPSDFLKRGG